MDGPPPPPPAFPSPDGPPDGEPPIVDPASCALLGPPALLVQGSMLLLVLVSLLVKRQYEKSKRTKTVWAMDVSKQLSGAAFVHASNLLISDQVAHHGNSDACASYLLNVVVDTTLGVLFLYLALRFFTFLAVEMFHSEGCISGKYGKPPRLLYLVKQTAIYWAALLAMKALVLVLFYFTLPRILLPAAEFVLEWMPEWLRVLFVMAVAPLLLNVLQFCIIDTLIKAKSDGSPAAANDPLLPKHAGDLSDSEDEDEEGESRSTPNTARASRGDSTSFSLHDQEAGLDQPEQLFKRNSFQADGSARRSSAGSSGRGRQFVGMAGLAVPGSPNVEPPTPGQSVPSNYGSTSTSPALRPHAGTPVAGPSATKEGGRESRGRSRSREPRGERHRSASRRRHSRSREAGEDDTPTPFELEPQDAVAEQVARILNGQDASGGYHPRQIPESTLRAARRSLSSDSGMEVRGRGGPKGVAREDVSLEGRLRSKQV